LTSASDAGTLELEPPHDHKLVENVVVSRLIEEGIKGYAILITKG
jgi:hypothetical protein